VTLFTLYILFCSLSRRFLYKEKHISKSRWVSCNTGNQWLSDFDQSVLMWSKTSILSLPPTGITTSWAIVNAAEDFAFGSLFFYARDMINDG